MKKFFVLAMILSFNLYAESIHVGSISHIDEGRSPEEQTHIYLSDGYVLKVSENENKGLTDFEEAKEDKLQLKFIVDENRTILGVETLEQIVDGNPAPEPLISFEPTVLSSEAAAQNVFSSLRRGATSWSQCYNRAHVWAYESMKNLNLKSMKVFMFYTRKYIREYNFKWWFHVSPFTYVNSNGSTEERVLDRMFAKGPLTMKNWTDIFMRNKVTCPAITRYSEYENHQEDQFCYLFKASMYYLQPLDLDNLERTGTTKTEWLKYEVKRAYRNGFGVWTKSPESEF